LIHRSSPLETAPSPDGLDRTGAGKWTVPVDSDVDGLAIAPDGTIYVPLQNG